MTKPFEVSTPNIDGPLPVRAATFDEALAIAKRRGFEAAIFLEVDPPADQPNTTGDFHLVASWSPLYGIRIHDRRLAN